MGDMQNRLAYIMSNLFAFLKYCAYVKHSWLSGCVTFDAAVPIPAIMFQNNGQYLFLGQRLRGKNRAQKVSTI